MLARRVLATFTVLLAAGYVTAQPGPQLLTVFALGGGAGSLGVSLAAAMVLVVPVVIAYVFLQRHFIESMAGAGIKG